MQNNPNVPAQEDSLDHQVPQRRSVKLHQVMNVGNEARTPNDGDALVYDASRGLWIPKSVQVSLEPGDIPDGSITEPKLASLAVSTRTLASNAVTGAKIAANAISSTQLASASVIDDKIGNRTMADGESITTSTAYNTGPLTTLLSRLATKIKEITGASSWRAAAPISLTALMTHKARHAVGGADRLYASDIGAAPEAHVHSTATTTTAGFMDTTQVKRLGEIGRTNVYISDANLGLLVNQYTTVGGPVRVDRYGYWQILYVIKFTGSQSTDNRILIELGWGSSTTMNVINSYNFIKQAGQMQETFTGVYLYHYPLTTGKHDLFVRVLPLQTVNFDHIQMSASWTGQDPESQT